MYAQKVAPIGLVVFGTFLTMGGCGSDTLTIDDFPAALERAACCAGTCQVLPTHAVGAPCTPISDRCAEGAFCDDGTCALELPAGSACFGGGCVPPAVCLRAPDGSSETCTIISTAAGAPCIP